MKTRFEARRPGYRVVIAAAGSQILRLQIEQGLRAHAFASANRNHIDTLVHKNLAHSPRRFARNKLALALSRRSDLKLENFRELSRAKRIVLASPRVPAGAYTETVLRRADAMLHPGFRAAVLSRVVSRELNVRLVLTRVELGAADAGIVYASDVKGRRVQVVPIPPRLNVSAEYSMALLRASPDLKAGALWRDFVLSPEGQSILSRHGFGPG